MNEYKAKMFSFNFLENETDHSASQRIKNTNYVFLMIGKSLLIAIVFIANNCATKREFLV